jgi:hypothetical protein
MGSMKDRWIPSTTLEGILPQLAEVPNINWLKPLNEWSKAEMVTFLRAALGLVREAEAVTPFDDPIPF